MGRHEKFRLCTVDGCGDKHIARGYCWNHYKRFRSHGDPLAGRAFNGDALRYYTETVLSHDSDECLIWPFARNPEPDGRAMRYLGGKMVTVARHLCIEVHGQPPTPEHVAAHSCGNGRMGCVAKRHLRWATKKENGEDRARHGLMEKRIAALEEALKPFAEAADAYDPDEGDDRDVAWAHDFTIGSLRRARTLTKG